MIAFDTNLLVRFITQDDPKQAAQVETLLAKVQREKLGVLICDTVLCELVWVLEGCYNQSSAEIAAVLDRILRIPLFTFQSKDQLWAALSDYRTGKADFSDYLIGRTAKAAGAAKTYTFDRVLKSSSLFELLT